MYVVQVSLLIGKGYTGLFEVVLTRLGSIVRDSMYWEHRCNTTYNEEQISDLAKPILHQGSVFVPDGPCDSCFFFSSPNYSWICLHHDSFWSVSLVVTVTPWLQFPVHCAYLSL
jgi:hypothetical protein